MHYECADCARHGYGRDPWGTRDFMGKGKGGLEHVRGAVKDAYKQVNRKVHESTAQLAGCGTADCGGERSTVLMHSAEDCEILQSQAPQNRSARHTVFGPEKKLGFGIGARGASPQTVEKTPSFNLEGKKTRRSRLRRTGTTSVFGGTTSVYGSTTGTSVYGSSTWGSSS